MIMKTGRQIRLEFSKVAAIVTAMMLVLSYSMSTSGSAFMRQQSDLMFPRFISPVPVAYQPQSSEELAKGKLLVASRQIKSSLFAESVVFLVDYNLSGAMGLIINKRTGIKLSSILPEIDGLRRTADTVYVGGPVSGNKITMLIRSKDKPEESKQILEDIYFGFSKVVLQQMVDDNTDGDNFHLFAGYSGWAAGQLERELSRGDWHVMAADAEFIFDKEPSDVWYELIRRTSVRWAEVNANENIQQF
jgi:putative transcriptional regulator